MQIFQATSVRRHNEAGIDGLAGRARSGCPASLTKAEQAEVAARVKQGADLATDGVVRFRRVDIRDRVAGLDRCAVAGDMPNQAIRMGLLRPNFHTCEENNKLYQGNNCLNLI